MSRWAADLKAKVGFDQAEVCSVQSIETVILNYRVMNARSAWQLDVRFHSTPLDETLLPPKSAGTLPTYIGKLALGTNATPKALNSDQAKGVLQCCKMWPLSPHSGK